MNRTSRESWAPTTHDWAEELDLPHLDQARRRAQPIGPAELVHMILEVLAYADDEAESQGVTGAAHVGIRANEVTVTDTGRGTDTRLDEFGAVIRKPVMATRDVRFYDRADAPLLPDGRQRQGMSTVAAVCEELVHVNRRSDGAWSQSYRFGVPATDLVPVTHWSGTGTTVQLRGLHPALLDALDRSTLARFVREFDHLEVSLHIDQEAQSSVRTERPASCSD